MSESATPTQQDPERLRVNSHAREKYRSEVLSPTDWPIEDALAHGNALPASARELWATRRNPAPDDVIWSPTARVALLVRNDRVRTVTHARQLDEEQRQAVAQVDDSVERGDGPVTDGGTDRLPVDCPADGCEARIESRGDALVHILAHAGDDDAGVEIVDDSGAGGVL